VKEKKNELFWAFNKSKRKLLRNEQEENENQTFVHEEKKRTSQRGFICIS
jgi:hypothetical protein